MSSSSSGDILSQLRTGTAEAHRRLEERIDISKVCSTLQGYERLLNRFLGFFEPMESALQSVDGWAGRGFDWGERAKTQLLYQDLHELGFSPSSIAALPRCMDVPRPRILTEAFGSAYVLEGATLGGQQILKILAKSDIPASARHYFASYGEKVGIRWRDFCAMLGSFDSTAGIAMVPMAVETFEKLGAWLDQSR